MSDILLAPVRFAWALGRGSLAAVVLAVMGAIVVAVMWAIVGVILVALSVGFSGQADLGWFGSWKAMLGVALFIGAPWGALVGFYRGFFKIAD